MGLGDEFVQRPFMFGQKRLDVCKIQCCGTLLRRWKDQVQVQEEAKPRVEWHPAENEIEMRLGQEEEVESGPVNQPGRKIGWIAGPESFVGEEYRKKDGEARSTARLAKLR
jgi:hypothetical protein